MNLHLCDRSDHSVRTERDVTAYIQSRPERPACVLLYAPLESELPKIPTDQSRSCQWLDRFFFVHMSAPTAPQLKQWWWKCSKTLWGYKLGYHPLLWPHTHTHRLSLSPPPLSCITFFLPPFFHQSPSYPESESVCLENIYFDLFFMAPWMHCSCEQSCVSLIMKERAKQRERGMEKESNWGRRARASASRVYWIMMTHWFRSMCHILGGKGRHLTRSGHSVVPACFN